MTDTVGFAITLMTGVPRAVDSDSPEGVATDCVLRTTVPTADVNDCPVTFTCAPA